MSERSTFWLSHLSAIKAEGITAKAYAGCEWLSLQALYQWRKRLVAVPAAPSLVDLSRSRSNPR